MSNRLELPTKEYLRNVLEYKDGILIWKERPKFSKYLLNKEAGYVGSYGYKYMKINNIRYSIHRIIWVYHYGDIPRDKQIDHINRNRLDNRIENLRLVSVIQNSHNRGLNDNNTSGYSGVVWCKYMKMWKSGIKRMGKHYHLGYFKNKEDAISARKKIETSLNLV